jgi:uncharacterized protein (DUF1800 family)
MDINRIKVCRVAIALLALIFFPTQSAALTFPEALHLSLRAGLGPDSDLAEHLLLLEKKNAINYLLHRRGNDFFIPNCAEDTLLLSSEIKKLSLVEKKIVRRTKNKCKLELRQAYANHLIGVVSSDVLLHRMDLFWHNHFTSSLTKVPYAALIYNQHNVIHKNAMGDFRLLLHSMIRDPAMLLYLDNTKNNKAKPNENLARELLELFSLGVGNYSEKDVKEVARALTGLSVDPATLAPRFYPERHDYGKKTILDESGYFGAYAVVEILLSKPEMANYIAKKLWLEFVSKEDPETIARLASRFYQDWSISDLLKGILMSNAFWVDAGKMIKSPLELVIGGSRLLPGMVPGNSVPALVRRMGQDIFDPPNVKGWPKGSDWINSRYFIERLKFSEQLTRGLQVRRYEKELSFICAHGASEFLALPELIEAASPKLVNIDDDGEACVEDLARVLEHPAWQLK